MKQCTGVQTGVSDLHPGAIKHKYIRYVAIFNWFLTQKLHLKGKTHCLCLEGTQVKLQGVWRRPLHGNDSFGWRERLLLARALTGVSLIGCSDAEAISTSDCQSMMSLRKGWMDGRIGCKVLYILALECSHFFRKKLKNAPREARSPEKK